MGLQDGWTMQSVKYLRTLIADCRTTLAFRVAPKWTGIVF